MKDIIVIAGPTGVGKTKLSVELAKLIDAEIVNADSMQVYRNLSIGTAKIKESEKEGIVHHLFDIKDVEELYTIYDYQKDARKCIANILSRNKKVILVGGSGLYIRACLYNYNFKEELINKNYDNYSTETLYEMVQNIDKDTNIHPNNRKRLIRFLNKHENGSINEEIAKPIYDFSIVGLTTDRENLYRIINKRVDKMLQDGLLEEVKTLYDKKINSKAINTGIGYKELYKYFDGEISLGEAVDLIKKNSRHYAKRQYTFFNNQFQMKWFETNYLDFSSTVNEIYKYLEESNNKIG